MNEKFHSSTSDIKIRSSDGIEFDLHRTLLEAYTGAFPGPELDTGGEVLQLTETGNVLKILFEFVYPQRHPDLEDKDFDLIAAVAEAVGKYEVYSAINTCNTRMRFFLPTRATDIFVYAMKHDHPKLANEAIPYIVRAPLIPVLKKLPLCYLLPWTQHHEAWSSILKDARRAIKCMPSATQHNLCHSGPAVCNTCRGSLYTWVTGLEELDTAFALKGALSLAKISNTGLSCCKTATLSNPTSSSAFSAPVLPHHSSAFSTPAMPIANVNTKCDHMVNLAKTCEDKVMAIPPFSKV
ncbi:hypothetical protein GALMADRAFT_1107674 [Galerina marginata CBS 339.88]|uniref:BTB domain-containing protein n=1 Tax=Galerina marginata (strain CBS 339.88) TaxID=685588 RepID=A0A067TEL7_GALM3|nr:hypothetical protein GALMADRAFT_1107674 [Galerina marginata CBS 339.88]